MSKETFNYLCGKLRIHIEKRYTNKRSAISFKQRVAICLWFLASSVEYRTIAHLFGVSRPSVCLIVHNVCKVIVKVLVPRYVRLPKNEDELTGIVEGFKQLWGFPCGGAIDG